MTKYVIYYKMNDIRLKREVSNLHKGPKSNLISIGTEKAGLASLEAFCNIIGQKHEATDNEFLSVKGVELLSGTRQYF